MNGRPVYWHQGLFLQPQHFQLLQEQTEEQLSALLPHLAPFFWGIASGGLNTAALAAGRIEMAATRLIFPGNSRMLSLPGNAICGGRRIAAADIPEGGLLVFAALRAPRPGERRVTVAETEAAMASSATRFAVSADPERIPDAYADGPEAEVRRMVHVLHLVLEHELEEAGMMEMLPVARLLQEQDRVIPDPDFIPPCLGLDASPVLSGLFHEIIERVTGKARQLEGYKALSLGGPLSPEAPLMLMALRTLSRHAAGLAHLAGLPHLSPWTACGALLELAAELSVFSLSLSLLTEDAEGEKPLPGYRHDNPGPCFLAVRDLVFHLLDAISAGPRFVTAFELQDTCRTARVPQQIFNEIRTSGGAFWLVLHSGEQKPDLLAASASRMVKIAATNRMESLLVRALPGLPLTFSSNPPPGMPRRQGAAYFRIETESALWQEVEKNGSLSLHWPEAPPDLDAQLAVLTR